MSNIDAKERDHPKWHAARLNTYASGPERPLIIIAGAAAQYTKTAIRALCSIKAG
ncbi:MULTISPECIES: hypothetical protein [Roseobacteraceae]|uniref:hypothetical protein n=1 Tax=Roseobacteraceae TaxID=2854170 RepID=UPI00215814BB|nr:hypothetical protein [Salipiger pentaromativorans]MCR8547714.1 hypothetical protein [Salipiger pentaromativorans]